MCAPLPAVCYQATRTHTQARWSDIFIHSQRQTIRVISPTEQGDRIALSPAYCALYFCTVASQRQASWPPQKTLCVCAYLCVSLEQKSERERDVVFLGRLTWLMCFPAILAQRRAGIKEGQCGFSSQSRSTKPHDWSHISDLGNSAAVTTVSTYCVYSVSSRIGQTWLQTMWVLWLCQIKRICTL